MKPASIDDDGATGDAGPSGQISTALCEDTPGAGSSEADAHSLTLREARRRFEREFITAVLAQHHGRMADTARALGIQRTNLYRKMRQLKVGRAALSAAS
jgi:DNA-binding NtrC family response regulator